jgi:hypothetical protein
MKPNTKYSQFLHDLYTSSAQTNTVACRAARRIVCATPSMAGGKFTPETNDHAPRGESLFCLCGRPRPGRRICVFGFADGSVSVHIQRAVRLESGLRAVWFNRFSLRADAGRMLGDMLLSPYMHELRSNAAK